MDTQSDEEMDFCTLGMFIIGMRSASVQHLNKEYAVRVLSSDTTTLQTTSTQPRPKRINPPI